MFRGNSDRNSVVSYTLLRPFKAQYVRFHPKSWRSHISMRAEVYGCLKGTNDIRDDQAKEEITIIRDILISII